MPMIDVSIPQLEGADLNDEKTLRKLVSYLYKLDEQLRYVLTNLGDDNLSDSLRAIINTTADADALNELTGRLQQLSTKIVQTAEAIELKASKEELDTLGEALSESISELRVTADEIQMSVSNKLDADAPSVGVVTSGITITSEQVKITSPETVIAIPDESGEQMAAQFDDAGLTAQKIYCPNVAVAYDGPRVLYVAPGFTAEQIESGYQQPGDAFRTLREALNALSHKTLYASVVINLTSGMNEYGNVMLEGCISSFGVTINGTSTSNHAVIHGKVSFAHCLGYVRIQNVDVRSAASTDGICAYGNGIFLEVANCVLTGSGSGSGLYPSDGAKMYAHDTQIYDYAFSVYAYMMAEMRMNNNAGNCRIGVDGARIYASGTEPCDTTSFTWTYWNAGELRNSSCTVDKGSGGTTPTAIETTSWTLSASGSYKAGGSRIRAEIAQGWYSSIGRIVGCMWFDNASLRSAVSGRTVLNATLTLTMWKGVGRGTTVTVELAGTTAEAGASSASVSQSYGVIGTAEPGEETEFAIPAAAVTALANGTINGLALYSSDTGAYKERSYSKNYAVFDGADGDKPVLKVTYQ